MTQTEIEARARTLAYLRPKAREKMMKELKVWDGQDHLLDPRDQGPFIDGLRQELEQCERMGQYPAVPYEEFSSFVQKPRTAHLLEALKFFWMMGRVVLINDTTALPPRKGFLAQILVL